MCILRARARARVCVCVLLILARPNGGRTCRVEVEEAVLVGAVVAMTAVMAVAVLLQRWSVGGDEGGRGRGGGGDDGGSGDYHDGSRCGSGSGDGRFIAMTIHTRRLRRMGYRPTRQHLYRHPTAYHPIRTSSKPPPGFESKDLQASLWGGAITDAKSPLPPRSVGLHFHLLRHEGRGKTPRIPQRNPEITAPAD
ncbi:Protein of unknown function [Gryllus bimaculatus]|nr:Protein of unknown function [Gryllus bimaculatus]